MKNHVLNPNTDLLGQVRRIVENGADKNDTVEITGVVYFHGLLANVEENPGNTSINDELHNELIGFGVSEGSFFRYKQVVSATELEVVYTTCLSGLKEFV